MSFRPHSVFLVPGYGHMGPGIYDRGRADGRYSELDVVDGYLPSILDELENEGIRYAVAETRSAPGLSTADRAKAVETGSVVLHLRCGFSVRGGGEHNTTVVRHGPGLGAKDFAEEIAEAVGEWGQCYVFGHRTANVGLSKPGEDPILTAPGSIGCRLEPFDLAGADVKEYLRRLPQLGSCIGRAITGFLRHRGGSARARVPQTIAGD